MKFLTCPVCEQVFVTLIDKSNSLTCCTNQLDKLEKQSLIDTSDAHKPNIRKIGNFVTITIGNDHPMIDVHYISFIFIETNQGFQFKNLDINQKPKAEFILAKEEEIVNIYVYCNVHLLWSLY